MTLSNVSFIRREIKPTYHIVSNYVYLNDLICCICHVSIEIKHELLDHYLYVLACLGSCYKYSFTWKEQVRKCVVYLICSVQLINDNCGNIVLVSDDPMSYLYTQRSHRYNFKVKTLLAT